MSKPMSLPVVLHVAPVTHDRASGFTSSVPATISALHRLGVPTGLLTTSPRGPYAKAQPYPVAYVRDLPVLAAISSMSRPLNRPDLVVFHSTYIPVHALLSYAARRRGIPYVITPRGGMTRGAQRVKRLKKRLGNILFFSAMVRRAAAVHCLTEREAADVRAWGCPTFVVGNGVELPPPDHLAQPSRDRGLRLVFVGRLDMYHKGLDLLIEACALVRDDLRRADAQIHLYGPDVGSCKSTIERMIVASNLQRLVRLHGPVYAAEKEYVFRGADVFLHTSRFEGHPMAVLEALSYGVPCLLTTGTNLSADVVGAGAGWEAAGSVESIASAIGQVLHGAHNLHKMGAAARRLTEEEYSWDQIGRRLLEHYQELVQV